ncbi:hypothetical protein CR513_28015, partial [Mucuna pruriens]
MVLSEDGEVDIESSCEDSSSSSGGESSSEGSHYERDLLMVKRLLSNTIEEETESQRETIFHSRCLVHGMKQAMKEFVNNIHGEQALGFHILRPIMTSIVNSSMSTLSPIVKSNLCADSDSNSRL